MQGLFHKVDARALIPKTLAFFPFLVLKRYWHPCICKGISTKSMVFLKKSRSVSFERLVDLGIFADARAFEQNLGLFSRKRWLFSRKRWLFERHVGLFAESVRLCSEGRCGYV